MSTSRRSRDLARSKSERQSERRSREHQRRRRLNLVTLGVLAVVIIAAVTWFALTRPPTTQAQAPLPMPTEPLAPDVPSTGQPVDGCTPPEPTRSDSLVFPTWSAQLAEGVDYTWTLSTNCGTIDIAMDGLAAPITTEAIAFLTDEGYYDMTPCHRLTTAGIFVLQCGDPTGLGTGGPGFSLPEENLPPEASSNYPAGTVAMANAGPGTTGSQFFLVYKDTSLPADYTVVGTIVSGLDRLQAIAAAGVVNGGSDGPPNQQVMITQATVSN